MAIENVKKTLILALSTLDIDFWQFVTRKKKAGDGLGFRGFFFYICDVAEAVIIYNIV
jgi:hypothetical protein